ncbi:MAG: hypothetical protein H9806_02420 [Candidatus Lactobacillus pullistercoris]|uniref:Uncharacterized protein n=1 Tax=Candidatus Lactobacillus pullistercoris TaxID=2838636 RepID=A0A9E2KS15_9LACO|nr:hypothetical protein [Candidatus Lactobacillus pullistercoris]
MNKRKVFPIIYAVISAIISYIAVFFICVRSLKINLSVSIIIAGIIAICFYILSYFRAHASIEIKRIVFKYKLTDKELARITGLKASDFPIYHNKLQLILPKRYWPKVLNALQEYEKNFK